KPYGRQTYVGYYLIDEGFDQLKEAAQMRFNTKQGLTNFMEKRPVFIYLSFITILTLAIAFGMLSVAWIYGDFSWQFLILVAVICMAGAAHLAISFTNWLATIWIKPRILPKFDFSKGIPVK